MNLQLFLHGVSLTTEAIPAELSFPDKPDINGISLQFIQDKSDIVYPEQVLLFGITLQEMQPLQTQVRRRKIVTI